MIPESKQGGYPWDVWEAAMQAELDIRNQADHPTDIIARAILASRLTRQEDEIRKAALEERKDRERQIRVSEMRYAVTFLYEFAAEMKDPTAKAVLNLAADNWGRARSRALSQKGDEADG